MKKYFALLVIALSIAGLLASPSIALAEDGQVAMIAAPAGADDQYKTWPKSATEAPAGDPLYIPDLSGTEWGFYTEGMLALQESAIKVCGDPAVQYMVAQMVANGPEMLDIGLNRVVPADVDHGYGYQVSQTKLDDELSAMGRKTDGSFPPYVQYQRAPNLHTMLTLVKCDGIPPVA